MEGFRFFLNFSLIKAGQQQVRIITDEELTESDVRTRSLFIIGGPEENSAAKRFAEQLPDGFSIEKGKLNLNGQVITEPASVLVVLRNTFNSSKAVAVYCGSSEHEIVAPAGKLVHYGNYGYLSFSSGKIGEKGTVGVVANPLIHVF